MTSFAYLKLIKAIAIYITLLFSTSVLFSIIYYYSQDLNITIFNYQSFRNYYYWLYFALMNFFGTVDFDAVPNNLYGLVVIQHLINSIIIPVSSGIIFFYISNPLPKIIFPQYLIVRKRTSDASKGKITLSSMIGNKTKNNIYDITCQLVFIYFVKNNNGEITTNGETIFEQNIPYIKNYYRFSFELELFPKEMIDTIIDREGLNKNSQIAIIISGKFGNISEKFMFEKVYKFSNIIIAKENEKIRNYSQDTQGNLIITKTNWSKFNELVFYSEAERAQIIEEIRNIQLEKSREIIGT